MRKELYLILLFINLLPNGMKADEGMWTLYNLPNAVYETMKQENYELPYGALYEGDDAGGARLYAQRLCVELL